MSRLVGVLCAGTLLVAAAGCSLNSLLVSFTGNGKQQVVAGSVDQVSARLQASLSNVGILVRANRTGEDVRLAGMTRTGKNFTLVLKRQQTEAGEHTAILVEWERDADEQFWLTVLNLFVAPPAPPGQGPGNFPPAYQTDSAPSGTFTK